MKKLSSQLISALFVSALAMSAASSFAKGPLNASAQSSAGVSLVTGSVVVGTLASVAGGSQIVVESVDKIGDGIVYVLKNLSTGAKVSIKASATGASAVSVGIGTAVTVVADASGHALMASGQIIAYIPNEIGKSLLHDKKSAERVQS